MAVGDMLFLVATFAILLVLVGKFAWTPVTKMMTARQEKIDGDIDYAEDARVKAEELLNQREAALKNSKADAVTIVNTAKDNGEKQRQEILAKAQAEVTTLKQNADKDIAQARQEALSGAKKDVADLSLAIAEKIIGKELDASAQRALIDGYIEELGDVNGDN